jgi:alpha-beta hydrolase superfamily lysophospholipase
MAESERFFRSWEVDPHRAVIALVHGIAEHSGRYEHVAERLNRHGYSVVAVDLTGHGHAPGQLAAAEGLHEWHADCAAVIERARATAGGTPVFLLGHSLGSLISASYVVANGDDGLQGLVLSAPAVLASDIYIEATGSGAGVPAWTVSRDPEVVRAYEEDPLIFHDRVGPELNAYGLEAAIATNAGAGEIRLPVLILQGEGDPVADPAGTKELFEMLGSLDKTLRLYPELYHEVMNEPEKDQVLGDLVAWLDEHTS